MSFLRTNSDNPSTKFSLKCFRSMLQLLSDRANYYCHNLLDLHTPIVNSKINILEQYHQTNVKKMCESWFDYYNAKVYIDHLSTITDAPTKKVFEDIFKIHFLSKINSEGDYFRELLGDAEFDSIRDHIITLLKYFFSSFSCD